MVSVSEEVATPPPFALWSSVAMRFIMAAGGGAGAGRQAVMTALAMRQHHEHVLMAITPARAPAEPGKSALRMPTERATTAQTASDPAER